MSFIIEDAQSSHPRSAIVRACRKKHLWAINNLVVILPTRDDVVYGVSWCVSLLLKLFFPWWLQWSALTVHNHRWLVFSRFEDADTSDDAPQFKYRFLVKPAMCRLSLRVLLEGFLPTRPRSAKKKAQGDGWRCCTGWGLIASHAALFFSLGKATVTDMIFPIFLPVWMTEEPSPSQVENTFNKAPVWQHYYS